MKLEVGKTYETRYGKPVKITGLSGDENYPYNGDNGETYKEDGVFYQGAIDRLDLIKCLDAPDNGMYVRILEAMIGPDMCAIARKIEENLNAS